MSTSDEMVSNALKLIGVKGGETPLSALELSDGMATLNRMALQLNEEGFELGFTVLTSGSDTVTIPDYSEEYFTNQLAARLAPEYSAEVPVFLTDAIQSSRRVVVRALNSKAVGLTGTIRNLIYSAIEALNVKAAAEPLTTTEIENGLPKYNDLVNELAGSGFETGATTGATIDDNHDISSYAISWYKSQLAARIAPSYGVDLNQTIISLLDSGRRVSVTTQNSKAVGLLGTYQNIIYGAIEMLNAKSGESPITTVELQNAMPVLNDVILSIESKSINLGYQINNTSVLTGNHELPDWSWGWIKAELAIRLSSSYGVPANDNVITAAREGLSNAYMRLYDAPSVNLPSTLPTGDAYGSFYGDPTKDALLTGSNDFLLDDENNILLGE